MSVCRRQRGFTYFAILFAVAAIGFGVAAFAEAWSHARQREKEAELLWIGNQFRQAIGLYYERSPGAVKRYPERLDELLQDRRFPTTQRYLRRVYSDPITGKADWELVAAPGGGVMGVKSRSGSRPVGRMASASTYASWPFVYEPMAVVTACTPPARACSGR